MEEKTNPTTTNTDNNSTPSTEDQNHQTHFWIVILFFIVFWPLGVVFMWMWMKTWPKWAKWTITTICTLPFVLVIILTILFLTVLDPKTALEQSLNADTSLTPAPTTSWETHSSQDLGLSIMHPNDVQITETIIKQSEVDPGTNSIVVEKWGPTQSEGQEYHDALAFNIQVLPLNGEQFEAYVTEEVETIANRGIMITDGPNPVTVAGLSGQTFTTSTVIACNTTMLDSQNGNVIVIQDCTQDPTGLGFLKLRDQILATIKVTPSTSPSSPIKACQMDAKICPDGSAVGRSGPNCEFLPCPPLSSN